MAVEFNSFSSYLMFANTKMGNRAGPFSFGKTAAELGYVAIAIEAVVETAVAGVATAFSKIGGSEATLEKNRNWVSSSAFCVKWALADTILNIFCHPLICNESAARVSASQGGFTYPTGSVF